MHSSLCMVFIVCPPRPTKLWTQHFCVTKLWFVRENIANLSRLLRGLFLHMTNIRLGVLLAFISCCCKTRPLMASAALLNVIRIHLPSSSGSIHSWWILANFPSWTWGWEQINTSILFWEVWGKEAHTKCQCYPTTDYFTYYCCYRLLSFLTLKECTYQYKKSLQNWVQFWAVMFWGQRGVEGFFYLFIFFFHLALNWKELNKIDFGG